MPTAVVELPLPLLVVWVEEGGSGAGETIPLLVVGGVEMEEARAETVEAESAMAVEGTTQLEYYIGLDWNIGISEWDDSSLHNNHMRRVFLIGWGRGNSIEGVIE